MILFYRLTRSGVEDTLRQLLQRALAQGWHVMIRSPNTDHLARLDDALWTEPADGFIPHGRMESADAAHQPVLLGSGAALNDPQGIFLLDGAEADLDEARGLARVWLLFDSADPVQLGHARSYWKRVVDAGLHAQYWSEDTGRWIKEQERGAD